MRVEQGYITMFAVERIIYIVKGFKEVRLHFAEDNIYNKVT